MYAIVNKKTGLWVYGTDYRYFPCHQRTSKKWALTFENIDDVKRAFKKRGCGQNYRIVQVKLTVIAFIN